MREIVELTIHFICTALKLLKHGGVKFVMAENIALKQQLITLQRGKRRAPKLTSFDRVYFGLIGFVLSEHRIRKIAIAIKPAMILGFHKALVKRKYRCLYSNKVRKNPGRKGPDQVLIDLVIEMKCRNPSMGYGRIAMQIYKAFGIPISRFAVGRILRKNKSKLPSGDGPSWLTFIGHMKDSLWSVDLFRCESIALKSHWVMVVMDQFSRSIVGFSVHAGHCDGVVYCRMFNRIISGKTPPKYLSTDNDPLFRFHRWQANLRILDVEEIKSVPGIPTSHPYIDRLIGSIRREGLHHMLFLNESDLKNKLDQFQHYYNESRVHSSLALKTPTAITLGVEIEKKIVSLDDYRWKSHCSGLYKLPIAA